jgi:hypothetical protein
VVSDLLSNFEFAAILQIRRDPGRAEGMIANPRFDAGRFRAPADDAVGVLLEEGIGGQLAGLAAGATEEKAVDVIGDAGLFDVIVQTLVETMMAGGRPVFPVVGEQTLRDPPGRTSRRPTSPPAFRLNAWAARKKSPMPFFLSHPTRPHSLAQHRFQSTAARSRFKQC